MSPRRGRNALAGLALSLLLGTTVSSQGPSSEPDSPKSAIKPATAKNVLVVASPSLPADGKEGIQPVIMQGPPPVEPVPPVPRPVEPTVPAPPEAAAVSQSLFGNGALGASTLSEQRRLRFVGPSTDFLLGTEAFFRATTDAADLLGRSPSAVGTATHKRSPIVTDPRIHGSSLGQLLASGSYWFPVRQDLDTLMSKIDSRDIRDMIVIKGPYSALYGPAFEFIDLQLHESPRFQNGYETHSSSSVDYKTNAQQWNGRQSIWGGDHDWGYRITYGHRTGNDYRDGAGTQVQSSYNSRNVNAIFGLDFSPDSHLEFNYIRVDQTGVELPNQVVNINTLVTNAFELSYRLENQSCFDLLNADLWYNTTSFQGDATSPAKVAQVPFLNFYSVNLSTGKNESLGGKLAVGWGQVDSAQLTVGVDIRYLTQNLNQFASTDVFGPFPGFDFNTAIPQAYSSNPGIFAQGSLPVTDSLFLVGGGRIDFVQTHAARSVIEPADQIPFGFPPLNIPPVVTSDLEVALGGGSFDRNFLLGSLFLTSNYKITPCLTAVAGAAFAMRPPNMTELYSIGTFATALPQFTVANLVGNPRLRPEKRYQVDLGLKANYSRFRGTVGVYNAWIQDYITFDKISPQGFFLAYTNTDLAVLGGIDARGDYKLTSMLDLFGTLAYVRGQDLTRNGNAIAANRYRAADAPRSAVVRGSEPLPVIFPLETRAGIRLHEAGDAPAWGVELGARMVAAQHLIADSLGELPTPGFTTVDLRAFWRHKRLTCVAGVENLFDRFYQEHFDSHGQPVNQPVPLVPGAVIPTGSTTSIYQPGITFYFGSEIVF